MKYFLANHECNKRKTKNKDCIILWVFFFFYNFYERTGLFQDQVIKSILINIKSKSDDIIFKIMSTQNNLYISNAVQRDYMTFPKSQSFMA